MYRIPPQIRSEPHLRWALPDRVFFAAGACHILAYAFIASYQRGSLRAVWLKPDGGFAGNHVYVASRDWVFDYHGYSRPDAYLAHAWRKARRWWPDWNATQVELPAEVLISGAKSKTFDGLWLREPTQFLHDALPRAYAFLRRYPLPSNADC